jgi:hypothetical protein
MSGAGPLGIRARRHPAATADMASRCKPTQFRGRPGGSLDIRLVYYRGLAVPLWVISIRAESQVWQDRLPGNPRSAGTVGSAARGGRFQRARLVFVGAPWKRMSTSSAPGRELSC